MKECCKIFQFGDEFEWEFNLPDNKDDWKHVLTVEVENPRKKDNVLYAHAKPKEAEGFIRAENEEIYTLDPEAIMLMHQQGQQQKGVKVVWPDPSQGKSVWQQSF